MRQLTDIQRETLDWIKAFSRSNGVMPTRKEIADGLGLRHKSLIDQRLSAIERKGWIELRAGSPRYIKFLNDDLPLIVAGTVAAGEPILADDRIAARIPSSVAEAFRRKPDFFVRIRGFSMDRMGVGTGSVAAIKAQSDAENGDVIVARVDDEVTLKRYYRVDERHVELRPASTDEGQKTIQVDLESQAFEICGIAVGALIGDGFEPAD